MTERKKKRKELTDKDVKDLSKVAFANIDDFARFGPDGSVEIYDLAKAEEIGARVSIKTGREGRGKKAREFRQIEIRMPDKFPALLKLYDYYFGRQK